MDFQEYVEELRYIVVALMFIIPFNITFIGYDIVICYYVSTLTRLQAWKKTPSYFFSLSEYWSSQWLAYHGIIFIATRWTSISSSEPSRVPLGNAKLVNLGRFYVKCPFKFNIISLPWVTTFYGCLFMCKIQYLM